MNAIGTMIFNMLKTRDDGTLCPVKTFGVVFSVLASTAFLFLAFWTVMVLKQPFDYGGFGGGIASIWGAAGFTIAAKRWIETKVGGGPTDTK